MRTIYFDCFSGISGDMTLGALVHLGVPVEWLKTQLQDMPLDRFDITAHNVMRNGIQAIHVMVHTEEDHHHRHLHHIEALIQGSPYSDNVKKQALTIFDCLAEAEAKVHGCGKESVHFHEVGAMDAIIDIVGTCLGFEYLGITQIFSSALPMGHGFVTCAHGVLPVPAPAVVEILKHAPVYGGTVEGELVTPTGAAILAGSRASFGPMPAMRNIKAGYGAGTRELGEQPNVVRIVLGDCAEVMPEGALEKLMMVETCIDDMNPEIFGYLMEELFVDGALDVFWVPVQMKKNRPGTCIKVLCAPELRAQVVNRLLTETTTLGVRFYEVSRTVLPRETVEVDTTFGTIPVKRIQGAEGETRLMPEYEVCRRIAKERKIPLRQVYDLIMRANINQ
ncbi:MAG: nickel pincer cofactor biosynthesis protein LarC [Desulfobacteraceae bacterium]|nr:nickel pincer cofactor biosynthesis protein LarC [Desulfobacteraceae bacterium]